MKNFDINPKKFKTINNMVSFKLKDLESNIVYESKNEICYVYKMGLGHYEVRKNGVTSSTIIGNFDMPDEPNDSLARAKEMCDEESVK